MSIPRSKSAPHVGPIQSHRDALAKVDNTPRIVRHSSALVVTSLATPPNRHGSGRQSPRVEREEDPFSLSGFFPSQLALSNKLHIGGWKWLRSEGDDDSTGEYEAFTGYVSPVSEEDDEWMPSTPMFDHQEERTLEAIKQEDKLGILSLNDLFASLETDDINSNSAPLVSPYSEDDPVDSEALYSALCALRRAHTLSPTTAASDDIKSLSCAGLFSPVEETDEEKEDTDLEGVVSQGLRRLLALLPF